MSDSDNDKYLVTIVNYAWGLAIDVVRTRNDLHGEQRATAIVNLYNLFYSKMIGFKEINTEEITAILDKRTS